MSAATAQRAIPTENRPSTASVTPATNRPTIKASLWPDAMKLNRASGLSAPSHNARPGSVPRCRDRRGSDTMIAATPMSSAARNHRIWLTKEPPETVTVARLTITKSGP